MGLRQKTREKILLGSLELFNKSSASRVSTNHIAEHIGISPGNLYYYFTNKEAVIRAIFERMKNGVSRLWQTEANHPLPLVRDYIQVVFSTIFGFRFFFIELPLLLRSDPLLKTDYAEFQSRFIHELATLLQNLNLAGIIKPFAEDNYRLALAHNIWIVTIYWHCHLETTSEYGTSLGGQELLTQIFCLVAPYVEDQHYKVVQQFFMDFESTAEDFS